MQATKRRKTVATATATPALAGATAGGAVTYDVVAFEDIIKSRQVVQKLNSFLVPQMIARHGFRWHNAHVNASCLNLVREAIIRTNVIHPGVYDTSRPKNAEAKILTHLRKSNAHAFAQHHRIVRSIVQQLFEHDPTDPVMVKVKASVFDATMGIAIMSSTHPFIHTLHKEFVPPGEFLRFRSRFTRMHRS